MDKATKRLRDLGFLNEYDFNAHRLEYYDSREEYLRARRRQESEEDSEEELPSYLPTPLEIIQRAEHVQWMKHLGFPEVFIRSVMQFETPTIEVVRACVRRGYSAKEIYRRMRPFIFFTKTS